MPNEQLDHLGPAFLDRQSHLEIAGRSGQLLDAITASNPLAFAQPRKAILIYAEVDTDGTVKFTGVIAEIWGP